MSHICHAIGCEAPVKRERLMCYPHWRKVPIGLRRAVWALYRPGQCDDLNPSAAYCEAARKAVLAVAQAERRTIDVTDPKLKLYDAFAKENLG